MDKRYWIAINGPSCAICSMPLKEPLVTPTPEEMFGFLTLEEAERAQRICLMAPIKKVERFMEVELRLWVKAGPRPLYPPRSPAAVNPGRNRMDGIR
jgi:hypothetical protein